MTMKNYLCEFNNKRKSLNKITFKTSVKHTYKDTKDNSHQSEILLRFPKKNILKIWIQKIPRNSHTMQRKLNVVTEAKDIYISVV